MITLKALSYFGELPGLPADVQTRLIKAVESVDVSNIPVLTPYVGRVDNR